MFLELLLLFFTVLAVYCWKNSRSRRNLPPGPSPILPGLGNMLQLISYKADSSYATFNMLGDVYGPLVFVKFGQLDQLIVRDLALAKEILCSEVWVDRLWDDMIAERSFGKTLGVIFVSGDVWKEMRRFSMRTLRDFGFGKQQNMESVIDDEINILTTGLDKVAEKGSELPMRQFFTVSILNILWSMIAGFRFSHEDSKLKNLIGLIDETSKNVAKASIAQAYPWMYHVIKHIPVMKKRRTFISELQNFFKVILEERRKNGDYKNGSPKDFIDAFLQAIDEHEASGIQPNFYTDEQFIMVCYDLFIAGAETTSNTLEFAILYMVLFPEVQKKVQMEIDRAVGKNRRPTMEDRTNMPYTEATINEIQRVANVLPLTIRGCTQDTIVAGYDIPKGTVAGINVHGIHNSKELWGDPETFRPERFLDKDHNIINTNKLLPFGLGKRVCLGESLARASLFTYFTAVVQRYDISASSKRTKPSMTPMDGFTLTPHEYYVTIQQR